MRMLVLAFVLLSGCAVRPLWEQLGLLPLPMVEIEGGTFEMGDVLEGEDEDATPVHTVTLPPFRLGRTEVTFRQFDAWAEAMNQPLPDDEGWGRGERAVVNVTWGEALAFCQTYGYRLPTEAEWEYAARAEGLPMRFAGTSDPDSLYRFARVDAESERYAFPVALKQPNRLGLYDLTGNVAEWIGDYYQFYPAPGTEPEWTDFSLYGMRLFRGGSFDDPIRMARTFHRAGTLHDSRSHDVGFRCAADDRR